MGFWDTLGTIAGDVGGAFIGDPLLGNQVMPAIEGLVGGNDQPEGNVLSQVLNTAGGMSGPMAGAAKGRADARQIEAILNQNADRINTDRYVAQNDAALKNAALDLQRRQFGLNAPQTLANETARGDLLANVQPASISGLPSYIQKPNISGGLSPADLGPNARSAGQALSNQSLGHLQSGDLTKFAPVNLATLPPVNPTPTGNILDTILSTGGLAGGLLGALGKSGALGSGGGFGSTQGIDPSTGGMIGATPDSYTPGTDPYAGIDFSTGGMVGAGPNSYTPDTGSGGLDDFYNWLNFGG